MRPRSWSWTNAATAFFTLDSACYDRDSPIVTSNKGFGEWCELLGDSVIASAVLDRLQHDSHVLNIRGESYRSSRNVNRDYPRDESGQVRAS